jgi:hypothetical protein
MPTVETAVLPGFDYDALDDNDRLFVELTTREIESCLRMVTQQLIEIGFKLETVRDRIGYGGFDLWLGTEFTRITGRTARTGYRWIALAEKSRSSEIISELPLTVAYAMIGESEETIEAVNAVVETKGKITVKEANSIKKEAKKKPPAFEPGQEIYINAPQLPLLHGRAAKVAEIKGKQTIAEIEGKTVLLLPTEVSKTPPTNVVPTPSLPASAPKSPPEITPIESCLSRLEVEEERTKYLEDLLRQVCTAYHNSGEIPDELLEEIQETIGVVV